MRLGQHCRPVRVCQTVAISPAPPASWYSDCSYFPRLTICLYPVIQDNHISKYKARKHGMIHLAIPGNYCRNRILLVQSHSDNGATQPPNTHHCNGKQFYNFLQSALISRQWTNFTWIIIAAGLILYFQYLLCDQYSLSLNLLLAKLQKAQGSAISFK